MNCQLARPDRMTWDDPNLRNGPLLLQEHCVFWDVGVIKAFLHEATADRYVAVVSCLNYKVPGLVNSHITMENHHVEWENQLFLWPFSIAMLVYQRVRHDIAWYFGTSRGLTHFEISTNSAIGYRPTNGHSSHQDHQCFYLKLFFDMSKRLLKKTHRNIRSQFNSK